jgi:5S rRNA maturation endonuclease (ribonuclease M5)
MTQNITAHAERIARHYWGEPNAKLSIKGRTLRWGTKGSKELDLIKGAWYDFEAGEGGGCVDLVKKYGKLGISGSVADVLEREFGIQKQAQKALEPKQYIQRIYSYFDADGAEAYQVCRMYPKTFRQRRPDGRGGYIYKMDGVEPLPYNLPKIMQNPDQPVFVVEGEQCADALIEAGLVATTNHGGAGKWLDAHAQHLEGRNVIVMPDNDEAGLRHADKVVASLWGIAAHIKRVDLPGLPDKGDVVDFLREHTLGELVEIVQKCPTLTEAPEVSDDAVADEDGAIERYQTMRRDAVFAMPPVEFLVDGLITDTGFTMMYGAPGTGKSFLAIDIALSVAHGQAWQGQDVKTGPVLYIAGEGIGGFAKRWKAWENHHGVKDEPDLYLLPTAVNFREEEDIARLVATIEDIGQRFSLVIVDTVARAIAGAEENSSTDMGLFVAACDEIKALTGGALLAVHHAGKDANRGARGSTALLGAVDTSLMVGKSEDIVTLRTEKMKDAEPMDDINLTMLVVPASISETSVVLERTDEAPKKGRAKKDGWRDDPQAYHAFQALQNLLIERGVQRIHSNDWHEAHTAKEPDLDRRKRSAARQKLSDAGVVVCDKKIVWINRDLA